MHVLLTSPTRQQRVPSSPVLPGGDAAGSGAGGWARDEAPAQGLFPALAEAACPCQAAHPPRLPVAAPSPRPSPPSPCLTLPVSCCRPLSQRGIPRSPSQPLACWCWTVHGSAHPGKVSLSCGRGRQKGERFSHVSEQLQVFPRALLPEVSLSPPLPSWSKPAEDRIGTSFRVTSHISLSTVGEKAKSSIPPCPRAGGWQAARSGDISQRCSAAWPWHEGLWAMGGPPGPWGDQGTQRPPCLLWPGS